MPARFWTGLSTIFWGNVDFMFYIPMKPSFLVPKFHHNVSSGSVSKLHGLKHAIKKGTVYHICI